MNLGEAVTFVRSVLGDASESVWSDAEVYSALNTSNKRILARIVEQNPEQYIVSYEDYTNLQQDAGDSSIAPIQMASNTGMISMHSTLKQGFVTTEGQPYVRFNINPVRVLRLFYSTNSSMNERIEVPLVAFSSLDEKTQQQTLEYEVLSNTPYGKTIYKASYAAGTTLLYIRPIPTKTLYLKIYWAEAGATELTASTDAGQHLLTPWWMVASVDKSNFNFANTSKAEAVCFDAAWVLSFKDDSMRKACAEERERILATQLTPTSPSEAY